MARAKAPGRPVASFKIWLSLRGPSKVMVWTPGQTGVFLDRADRHRLYALYHLAAFHGLRRGELCGLVWENLDLGAEVVRVGGNRVRISWSEIEEGAAKTEASDGAIPLDRATIRVLRRHKAVQDAARLEMGPGWQDSGKVFTCEDGSALHPDEVSKQFLQLAFEAGLPPIRLHDLRHGAATLMLAGGAEMKLVQELLRHSSITITSDTYTSVLPQMAKDAAEAAAALVPRRRAGRSGTPGLPSGSQGDHERPGRRGHAASVQVRAVGSGAPGRIRTRDRRIRSPMLCPAELRAPLTCGNVWSDEGGTGSHAAG
jgi:integrase